MHFFMKYTFAVLCVLKIGVAYGYMQNQVQACKKALENPGKIINCSGCDLRGVQDFAGLDMHAAFMPNVSMQPCLHDDNKNVGMVCVAHQTTNLTGTNLSKAQLFSSCLDGVVFDKADLTDADLSNSSLEYASFVDAKLQGITTTASTFCHSIMPDGTECTDSWSGQGLTIDCNCSDQNESIVSTADVDQKEIVSQ